MKNNDIKSIIKMILIPFIYVVIIYIGIIIISGENSIIFISGLPMITFVMIIFLLVHFISTTMNSKIAVPEPNEDEKYKCPKCGRVVKKDDNYCGSCRHKLDGKNSLIVNSNSFDPMYKLDEKELLNTYITKELEKLKIDLKGLYTNEYLIRKNIFYIIFSILLFVYITSIFFHFPAATYVFGAIILIVYLILISKYTLNSYVVKEIKARPKEKISNILMNIKNEGHEDNYKLFRICCMVLALGIPLMLFKEPRIMYEKVDGGYGVRYYIFGLNNNTVATIPETYKGKPVVTLRGNTFSNMKHLKKVYLPDTVKEIRGQAFKNDTKLIEVNLPSNLEYLGGGAFYNCKSLKKIELPDTITEMGGETFTYASSLEEVKLPKNLPEIRGDSFAYCTSLRRIEIPDTVTRIGGHAFYGDTSLSEVVLTDKSQLNEIGSSAFRLCSSLTNITIPSSTYVNERAFKESPTSIHYFGEENNNSPEK